jgi:hypothetical protein
LLSIIGLSEVIAILSTIAFFTDMGGVTFFSLFCLMGVVVCGVAALMASEAKHLFK